MANTNASAVPGINGSGGPSATYGNSGENYGQILAYGLVSSYDIYQRDYYKKLIQRVPKAAALQWMRVVKGYMGKRKAKRFQYYYHENGQWMSASATVTTVVDNGTNATITLAPGDHLNGGKQSFPVVGQTVLFENQTAGYVYSVNRTVDSAHTVTVYPVDSTNYNIIAAAVVGSSMVFYSNAQQEQSSATESRTPNTDKVTNYIQAFRESYLASDFAQGNETEFEWNGIPFLHPLGIDEMMDRFAYQEDLALLVNPASNALTNANSKNIQMATGLIPQINANGNTLEYFGTPDMTTVDDAILILNRSYGEHDYIVGQGLNLNLGWKNWLIDFNLNSDKNISFDAFDKGKEQAVSLNFKSINIEPYNLHMQTWDCLAHSDSLGAGNMPYKDMAVFIPMGTTMNPEPGDGYNDREPYLQLVYADCGGAAHENKGDHRVWSDGALAPGGATSDAAFWRINAMSYKGLEIRCRNKFLILTKAA